MRRFWGSWPGLGYAWLLLLLPACSDEPSESGDGDEQTVCNDLVNDGPEVRYLVVAGTAPTPAGGTIADGTYALSAMNLYGVDPPAPAGVARAIFEIAGTTMQQVGEIDGDERTYTSTFTTSDTMLVIDDTCPEANHDTPAFTATSTELRFFSVAEGRTFEMVLTKR